MRKYRPLAQPGSLSRRRLIAGGSMGLLAVGATARTQATTGAKLPNGGTVEDRLAIEDLIYRYGIALDSLDRTAMEACFAPGTLKPELVDWVMDYHKKYAHTMHNMMNHTYQVRGHAATGVTYCIASMVKDNAGKLGMFDVHFMYRDELVKQGDRWFLSKRELEIIFSTEETPVQPGAPLLELSVKPGSFRTRPALTHAEP